jgi:hypothetical protein
MFQMHGVYTIEWYDEIEDAVSAAGVIYLE